MVRETQTRGPLSAEGSSQIDFVRKEPILNDTAIGFIRDYLVAGRLTKKAGRPISFIIDTFGLDGGAELLDLDPDEKEELKDDPDISIEVLPDGLHAHHEMPIIGGRRTVDITYTKPQYVTVAMGSTPVSPEYSKSRLKNPARTATELDFSLREEVGGRIEDMRLLIEIGSSSYSVRLASEHGYMMPDGTMIPPREVTKKYANITGRAISNKRLEAMSKIDPDDM